MKKKDIKDALSVDGGFNSQMNKIKSLETKQSELCGKFLAFENILSPLTKKIHSKIKEKDQEVIDKTKENLENQVIFLKKRETEFAQYKEESEEVLNKRAEALDEAEQRGLKHINYNHLVSDLNSNIEAQCERINSFEENILEILTSNNQSGMSQEKVEEKVEEIVKEKLSSSVDNRELEIFDPKFEWYSQDDTKLHLVLEDRSQFHGYTDCQEMDSIIFVNDNGENVCFDVVDLCLTCQSSINEYCKIRSARYN